LELNPSFNPEMRPFSGRANATPISDERQGPPHVLGQYV
jgi:hypothetical protein